LKKSKNNIKYLMTHDVIIVGSGPAGTTAAIYSCRGGFGTKLITGPNPGGQLTTTTEVENYPGITTIMGPQLCKNMINHAQSVGAIICNETVKSIKKSEDTFQVETNKGNYLSKTVIITTGATARTLKIPGESQLYGRGVSACATCDGIFYKGQNVAVIGGGDAAVEEAIYLSKLAKNVTLIHRRNKLRAQAVLQERLEKISNIKIMYNTQVVEFRGSKTLNTLKIQNSIDKTISEYACDGAFIAIGHDPASGFLSNLVSLDAQGYIKTTNTVFSDCAGLFVAGDVMDPKYRQAITAAGFGCMAALEAGNFLREKGL
jgi:thioredoxin reductase (NADPH)